MNKKQKIKETYIYDNIDLNNIKYEESTLDQELVKINQKIKETYEIDPRVLDIEYKIEKEYNDKKIMEQKFLDRISKERSLEKKINETFGQKTKIIEPYYQFSNKINENKIDIRSDQNTPEKTLKKRDFISENKDYNIIEPYSKKYFSISKPERHFNAKNTNKKITIEPENKIKSNEELSNEELNKSLLKAKALMLKKKFDQAELILEQSVKKGYRHSDLDYLLGETKRLKGLFELSEKILLNSISYDIHSPFCYYSLALCYIAMDNPEKAIKYLRKFLNYKKNIDAYIQLGVCYMSNKDFVEAALAFSKGLELEINSDIYLLRANAYEELDLIESAKKDYKNYKTLNPDFKQIFEKNIEIFQTKGEIYEAKKLKKQLLKLLSI